LCLGGAATSLRVKLGESLGSIQKFDLPLEEVTTPSLEALQAYSRGLKVISKEGPLTAIPFFERAIELDPNFAMAYRRLGVLQGNLDRGDFGIGAIERAFSLRDRVSERERLDISELYYLTIPGDYERSSQIARQWAKTYPNDSTPHLHLGLEYSALGRWPEAVTEEQEAVRLDADNAVAYQDLATFLLQSNQPEDAEKTITQALSHNVDRGFFRWPVYQLVFLKGDARAMEQVVADATAEGNGLLAAQAHTETYYGRLARARQFWRRKAELERRTGSPRLVGGWEWLAALHEAELGNFGAVRLRAADDLAGKLGWGQPVVAALDLARAGDTAKAEAICQALRKDNPSDTQLRVYWLPVVKGAIQIAKGDSASAVADLEEAHPYEFGAPGPFSVGTLYPAYLRGQAYLQAHDGAAAAAEFQKFLDHRTLVLNFPLGALAHLQLGRAYAMSGDTAKARSAYQDFLTLWKDADPDIPILNQAKAEYAKLQ
jgi:eukaryotic-like serine/threonine-protein kinase